MAPVRLVKPHYSGWMKSITWLLIYWLLAPANRLQLWCWLCRINESLPLPIARFMGPTWGPSEADRTQFGPMLPPWSLLSGLIVFQGPFLQTWFNLIQAWISNRMSIRLWEEITSPFPNFNSCTVDVLVGSSYFISDIITDVITYPCWD